MSGKRAAVAASLPARAYRTSAGACIVRPSHVDRDDASSVARGSRPLRYVIVRLSDVRETYVGGRMVRRQPGSVLAACAAGANTVAQANQPDAAGFWLGLWQGLISPITFLISLFNHDVNIYEVNNNGNWYNFGFMLGVAVVFSGPAGSSRAVPRRARSRR